jgi:hypothetical protein
MCELENTKQAEHSRYLLLQYVYTYCLSSYECSALLVLDSLVQTVRSYQKVLHFVFFLFLKNYIFSSDTKVVLNNFVQIKNYTNTSIIVYRSGNDYKDYCIDYDAISLLEEELE